MKIENITKVDRTIVQVGFNDDIRIDMQEKIKQLYRFISPAKDFSLYYPFDIDQLEDWKTILDWESISSNTQVKWSDELIKKYQDKWHWFYLTNNQSILCWNAELLEEFKDKVVWDFILSTSIDWTKELHERFEKYLPSHCNFDSIKKNTTDNRERFIKDGGVNDLSAVFNELYSYAKSIDDKEGIFILYDAIEVCFNNRISEKIIELK